MSVNKIVTKVDGTINKTIDFNDLASGLSAGGHTITVEAFNGATLISTQTRNFTIAAAAFEAETTSYMNALAIPNDGTATIYTGVSGSQLWTHVDELVSGLKTNALWTKLFYYYPLLGDTAALQKYNLKDTAAYPITWFGGWVYDNKGALGNGANAYGDTGFIPSTFKDVNSNGLSIVIGTNNVPTQSDVVEAGAFNGTSQASIIQVKKSSSDNEIRSRMNGEISLIPNADSRGIYTASKTSSTESVTFKNGILKSTWNSGGSLPPLESYMGNMNYNGSGYSYGYSNQRFQGAAEHTGLTDTETQTLHSLIDTFEAGLGRKTW